jgi:hypothetical protein
MYAVRRLEVPVVISVYASPLPRLIPDAPSASPPFSGLTMCLRTLSTIYYPEPNESVFHGSGLMEKVFYFNRMGELGQTVLDL